VFDQPEFKDLEKCTALDDYLFKMGVLITLRRGKRELLKDYFAKCSQNLSDQMKVMMFFPFLGEIVEVGKYLKDNGLPLKASLRIQSTFRQKKYLRSKKATILELLVTLKKEDSLKSPGERQIVFERVKSIGHDFWRQLFSFSLAIKAKNLPWALELKRELAKSSPYWNLIKSISFTHEEEIMIRDFILYVLTEYQEVFEDSEDIKILAERFSLFGHTSDFRLIKSQLNADWSLTEIRSKFKNPLLKSEYFDFWYLIMMNRTSDAELRQNFRKAISKRSLSKARPGQMWVFEYFFPADEKRRNEIIKKLLRMWKRKNLVDRYTVLRTASLPKIKKNLAEKEISFLRADFQMKREFFTEVLNTGYSTEGTLYELFQLGDKNEDNLWWLML
jgi:hypothetical protein